MDQETQQARRVSWFRTLGWSVKAFLQPTEFHPSDEGSFLTAATVCVRGDVVRRERYAGLSGVPVVAGKPLGQLSEMRASPYGFKPLGYL